MNIIKDWIRMMELKLDISTSYDEMVQLYGKINFLKDAHHLHHTKLVE